MLSYVLRRLLLMVPTLLGITFLVFLLLALAPGGIGAGLANAGGSGMEGSKIAAMQAYFEDRYGIKDPVLVQYGRWLARLSPLKFGTRDQVTPQGEYKSLPKSIDPPPMQRWFPLADELATLAHRVGDGAGDVTPIGDAERASAQRAFREAESAFINERQEYRKEVKLLGSELLDYAKEKGIGGAATRQRDCRFEVIEAHAPAKDFADWPHIAELATSMHGRYRRALESKAVMDRRFAERPFEEAGLALLPGALWLGAPDLGIAFSQGQPASALIGARLPVTILLNLIAFPIVYLVAITSGVLAAARRGSLFDIVSGGLFVALWSVPVVWAGTLAVGYLANSQYLGWFPVSGLSAKEADAWTFLPSSGAGGWTPGWLLDRLWHLALPVACIAYAQFAILAKQTRAAMLDNYSAEYVRTARAKGVDRATVAVRHVFRNSLLPVITMFVTVFPAMLAGSVIVERIFSVPGMGSLLLEAIGNRDRELILANTFMVAAVNLLALLAADLLYALADPRVTYE